MGRLGHKKNNCACDGENWADPVTKKKIVPVMRKKEQPRVTKKYSWHYANCISSIISLFYQVCDG